jgi:hypothetical protein
VFIHAYGWPPGVLDAVVLSTKIIEFPVQKYPKRIIEIELPGEIRKGKKRVPKKKRIEGLLHAHGDF